MNERNKGFTLVEILITVVILAVLVGVTIYGVTKYVTESRVNTDRKNANSMQSALSVLAADETFSDELKHYDDVDAWMFQISWKKAIAPTEMPTIIFGTGIDGVHTASIDSDGYTLSAMGAKHTVTPLTGINVTEKVLSLLPDGLPKSQTGDGFVMAVDFMSDGQTLAKVTTQPKTNAGFTLFQHDVTVTRVLADTDEYTLIVGYSRGARISSTGSVTPPDDGDEESSLTPVVTPDPPKKMYAVCLKDPGQISSAYYRSTFNWNGVSTTIKSHSVVTLGDKEDPAAKLAANGWTMDSVDFTFDFSNGGAGGLVTDGDNNVLSFYQPGFCKSQGTLKYEDGEWQVYTTYLGTMQWVKLSKLSGRSSQTVKIRPLYFIDSENVKTSFNTLKQIIWGAYYVDDPGDLTLQELKPGDNVNLNN